MEIEALIKKMKDINEALINFIEEADDCDSTFKILIQIIEKHEIFQNKEEIRVLFQLISKIADNYHRTSGFFDKFEKIFQYLIKDAPSPISNFISDYAKCNKRILFLLLEKKFIKPDEIFLNKYLQSRPSQYPYSMENHYYYYLYPVMKEFLSKITQQQIEEEIKQLFEIEDISIFTEKCQIGENDSYICSLIRSDSVEDFIVYVNRTNLSLLTRIKPSVYETNSLLINKYPTLIEYASFFGSIQIIQYLKYNKVPLTLSMWTYAVHSKNAELIHILEEYEVKPETNESYDKAIIESIKCNHNDISNYIKDNLYEIINQNDDDDQFYDNFNEDITNSLNFLFFPCEIESIICNPKNKKGFKLYQLCFQLTTITIPSSVTSIGNYAFSKCSTLTQIIIPSSITSIGNSAFNGCSSLKEIIIPSSVISIGNYAFSYCSSLTQIIIPSSVTSIGNSTFSKCSSLTQISIPSSVTSIGNDIFSFCSKLEQVSIPSSVTSIGNCAFSYCSSLTQIMIPSSVTSIGYYSFSYCISLSQITIPSSVTSIRNFTFSGCSSLTQMIIPSSVTSIGNDAFSGCTSLTDIIIPSSVISIGNHAFSFCSRLTQISIPSSATSIGDDAFNGCSSLTQIKTHSCLRTHKIGLNPQTQILRI